MADLPRLTPRHRLVLGLFFIGVGFLPFFTTFGIGPLHPSDIMGPSWLGFAAGSVFMAGGFALLMGEGSSSASALMALVIVVALAVVVNWIALGAGDRICAAPSSALSGDGVSGFWCRFSIAYVALMIDAFLLLVLTRLLQKMAGGPPRLRRLTKLVKVLVTVVLAPALLVIFLFTALRHLVTRLVGRKKSPA